MCFINCLVFVLGLGLGREYVILGERGVLGVERAGQERRVEEIWKKNEEDSGDEWRGQQKRSEKRIEEEL